MTGWLICAVLDVEAQSAPHETTIGDLIRGALPIAELLDAAAMMNHIE